MSDAINCSKVSTKVSLAMRFAFVSSTEAKKHSRLKLKDRSIMAVTKITLILKLNLFDFEDKY